MLDLCNLGKLHRKTWSRGLKLLTEKKLYSAQNKKDGLYLGVILSCIQQAIASVATNIGMEIGGRSFRIIYFHYRC